MFAIRRCHYIFHSVAGIRASAFSILWCGVVCRALVWFGVMWFGMLWCGVVWCGVVWLGEGRRGEWSGGGVGWCEERV